MEIKVPSKSSFLTGFFLGIFLVLILLGFSMGFLFEAQHKPSGIRFPPSPFQNIPQSKGWRNAPVKIVEFLDFECADCRLAAAILKKLSTRFRGKISREFHHLPASETPGQGSYLIHEWAACAAEQSRFWPFYEAVFDHPAPVTSSDLPQIASKARLNISKINACLENGRGKEIVRHDSKWAQQQGIFKAPAFLINGHKISGPFQEKHFSSFVEALAKSGSRPLQGGAVVLIRPSDPLPSDPSHLPEIQFEDLQGRPSRGPENAAFTLVEFNDFHCSLCAQIEPALAQLEQKFSGKIRRVWRHFPIAAHAGAEKTHTAAECAHEQGKFWEYHDKLFSIPQGAPRGQKFYMELAAGLQLDGSRFQQCLQSAQAREAVQRDIARGTQSGIKGIPAVSINGKLIYGAQSYETLEKKIQEIEKLAKA